MDERIAALLTRPDVQAARAWIESHDQHTLDLQQRIAAIPSPPFGETERGRFVAERFAAIGLAPRTDEVGNIIAQLGDGNRPGLIICSHLDTVFPADVPIAVERSGSRLTAPGIGDNARGVAGLLTLAEALVCNEVQLGGPITFVASVGEEGQGDLRGVKHLLSATSHQPPAFIAFDGPGLDRIVHRALGSRRARALFKGPGGHSWAAYGVPNPVHAVGIAIDRLAAIALPPSPRTALSVVRIGGGHSLNAIPAEAWLEFDLRSESKAALAEAWRAATTAIQRAADSVNRKRANGTAALEVEITALGERPSGTTDEAHPLVQAAIAATKALGGSPTLASASTDANVAISRGIPGIAIGAGGRGGEAHLTTEWYENVNGPAGIVRCLLVALAFE